MARFQTFQLNSQICTDHGWWRGTSLLLYSGWRLISVTARFSIFPLSLSKRGMAHCGWEQNSMRKPQLKHGHCHRSVFALQPHFWFEHSGFQLFNTSYTHFFFTWQLRKHFNGIFLVSQTKLFSDSIQIFGWILMSILVSESLVCHTELRLISSLR